LRKEYGRRSRQKVTPTAYGRTEDGFAGRHGGRPASECAENWISLFECEDTHGQIERAIYRRSPHLSPRPEDRRLFAFLNRSGRRHLDAVELGQNGKISDQAAVARQGHHTSSLESLRSQSSELASVTLVWTTPGATSRWRVSEQPVTAYRFDPEFPRCSFAPACLKFLPFPSVHGNGW